MKRIANKMPGGPLRTHLKYQKAKMNIWPTISSQKHIGIIQDFKVYFSKKKFVQPIVTEMEKSHTAEMQNLFSRQ